jgi:class 3 adenylate cyclase
VDVQTRYATTPDGAVAYQTFGSGKTDLVFMPGVMSHLDLFWTDPAAARFFRRLGSFARVHMFDRLGVGLSDRLTTVPPLERRAAELGAVMDHAELATAAVFGFSENGIVAAYYGAAHPGRVTSLVLACAIVKGVDPTCEWALSAEVLDRFLDAVDHWGEGRTLPLVAPSLASSSIQRRLFGTFERACASPGTARLLFEAIRDLDLTSVFPSIDVPTLVLARRDDPTIPLAQAEEVARRVPGARLAVVDGSDHIPWVGDFDTYVDHIEEFITGEQPRRAGNRSFMSLMFTDIVGSTERLAAMGDESWRQVLARHDAVTREVIDEHGGREIKSLGDGFLAVFPGPLAAVRCARALTGAVAPIGLEVRAGVHAGEVELVGDDIAGMAVHTAARIAALAGPSEVLVSPSVREIVAPTGGAFLAHGTHRLKGVGAMPLYRAEAPEDVAVPDVPRPLRRADRVALGLARRSPALMRGAMRLLPSRSRLSV